VGCSSLHKQQQQQGLAPNPLVRPCRCLTGACQ
jgi:hypothetical protein